MAPQTQLRFSECQGFCVKQAPKLKFTLFRGFRPAQISDCQFLAHDNSQPNTETVVINSTNGTAHVFKLRLNDCAKQVKHLSAQGAGGGPFNQPDRVENLVACCMFKQSRSLLGSLSAAGAKVGGAQETEERWVSQVFSGSNMNYQQQNSSEKVNAQVVTYTQKNELITFNIVDSAKAQAAQTPDETIDQDEKAMLEMINQSNTAQQ